MYFTYKQLYMIGKYSGALIIIHKHSFMIQNVDRKYSNIISRSQ